MCTMWMVRYNNGQELMYPSDNMLFQLLSNCKDVILVYEQVSGKVLIDKRPPKPERKNVFINIFQRLTK